MRRHLALLVFVLFAACPHLHAQQPSSAGPDAAFAPQDVAYLPAGIVEWHGEQSACGLDALKAGWLCQLAAAVCGGTSFPTLWLGPDASTPFDPQLYPRGTVTIPRELYDQATEEILSGLDRRGFKLCVYLSGHYPGVIPDVAARITQRGRMKVISVSENNVVQGMPAGDHAAAWETSLLMTMDPGLVNLTRLPPLPPTTHPAGDVIPAKPVFRRRPEMYGIYGADPRVWATRHYGRLGIEAVIKGIDREVRKSLDLPSRNLPSISFADQKTEGTADWYARLLPRDWMNRFTERPVIAVPLCTTFDQAVVASAEHTAAMTGGFVFPPIRYAPAAVSDALSMSAPVYERVVREHAAALADIGFRVICLIPSSDVHPDLLQRLRDIQIDGRQATVLISPAQPEIARAIREALPLAATIRTLDGPWTVSDGRRIASLEEERYGPADRRSYACDFELSESEARGSVLLDLGGVENLAEVALNETPVLTDHWPPYRMLVTGRVRPGLNTLRIVIRHQPQPTLDPWFDTPGVPRLRGPVRLSCWQP